MIDEISEENAATLNQTQVLDIFRHPDEFPLELAALPAVKLDRRELA